ncbi:PhzF family phenazine biosynthesis protein [Xenorhabdus bovienii]|uniref:PhzF family phenazine biosynthesis protein n=1 Tax=Xenorhabdus bovienii TaxID=40576 RepID=UPI0023B2EED2|nr:PhzF family phenazine biosynthesis protein [Xenorhabdus bovienii]MDE9442075.1 PhzF family phenazine biosynthesis protein [Xenorhabdus bovienii]MDE9464498.1 PhzF family phenazine biosynthesis protein [Xenorhabdus bovienii]MDE9486471.1 PhzF family phenazine biosynthesis protein [Xenorhabdus bovienii]
MPSYPIYHVDAFTEKSFSGNPAAVVLLDKWLTDEALIAIAAEINLSETAFLVGNQLRWFTPKVEVNLCGHGTLATAFVLIEHQSYQDNPITFTSLSGELRVSHQEGIFTLDFAATDCHEEKTLVSIMQDALGQNINEVFASHDRYICVMDSADQVLNTQPDFNKIAALPLAGLTITAPGESPVDFVSRYFAPAKGVNEDPVTGSTHCVLTPFWGKRLNKSTLHARQLSERGGDILCKTDGNRVYLTGKAKLFSHGQILLEDQ